MKPEEINIPKNYVDKTDETRNKLIRDMFPISEKKNEPFDKKCMKYPMTLSVVKYERLSLSSWKKMSLIQPPPQ